LTSLAYAVLGISFLNSRAAPREKMRDKQNHCNY
jgi:hypothetical protein